MSSGLEVQFRQAASIDDTSTMQKLMAQGININAPGPETGQTAAHRAAAKGHTSALHLLFNKGADFNLTDKKGKTAEDLTTDKSKIVFTLIKAGNDALAARRKIYPKTVEESAESEIRATFAYGNGEIEELQKLNIEASTRLMNGIKDEINGMIEELSNTALDSATVDKLLKRKLSPKMFAECTKKVIAAYSSFGTTQFEELQKINYDPTQIFLNIVKDELRHLSQDLAKLLTPSQKFYFTITLGMQATETVRAEYRVKNTACTFGKAVAASFLHLQCQKNSSFSAEMVYLVKPENKALRNGLVVLNRNTNQAASELSKSKSALIVDSFKNRIFFMEFSDWKDLPEAELEIYNSSNPPPFPEDFLLPKSTELFRKITEQYQKSTLQLYLDNYFL